MEGNPPTRNNFSQRTQALTRTHTLNCATRSESPLSGSMVFKMRSFSGNSRTTNSVSPQVTYSIRASWINIYCACETSNNLVRGKVKGQYYVHNRSDILIRWRLDLTTKGLLQLLSILGGILTTMVLYSYFIIFFLLFCKLKVNQSVCVCALLLPFLYQIRNTTTKNRSNAILRILKKNIPSIKSVALIKKFVNYNPGLNVCRHTSVCTIEILC